MKMIVCLELKFSYSNNFDPITFTFDILNLDYFIRIYSLKHQKSKTLGCKNK